jgi:16S rRNA (cytosine967-C5)-methyltransferase
MPNHVTARSIAVKVLTESRKLKKFAGELVEHYPQLIEKFRATDLVFGVIRNRGTIDLVIEKVSGRPIVHISAKLLNIIRVGLYELIYCPQSADHAIVHQAVEYAKQVGGDKGAGFVNAVLRKTQGHIVSREKQIEQADTQKTIPQTQQTGCEFDIEILPDRDSSPAEYLSIAFSLPDWLVEGWLAEFGEEQTAGICFASNRRPSVYLRPNLLKTTAENLAAKLGAGGIVCQIAPESQMIKLTHPGAISELPGFNEGLFVVQDLSASAPVGLLNPRQDCLILDFCAAPGTKTTQLAEATAGQAKIIATDIDAERLNMVRDNVDRLDLADCVTVIDYHAVDGVFKQSGGFDCVLVDAPCSNTGVLARRPEVRHRISRQAVGEIAKVQQDLLSQAAGMLRRGGVLCYSTCSLQPDENRLLVKRFLENNPGFSLKMDSLILPSAGEFDHDGGYAAVLAGENG